MTREQAIEILRGAIKKPNTKDGYLGQAIDMAIKALEQGPRKGHWVDCKCDKCGYVVQPWNTTSFCPNCGVDMRDKE